MCSGAESRSHMEFFTEDDLRVLGGYADKLYNGGEKAKAVERQLSEGVWAKTKEWATQLASISQGFVASCRRSVIKQAGSLPRQADGRRRMRRVFRPYSWAKLLREGYEDYGIFFTVGVEGRTQDEYLPELVWKLDCMRDGGKGIDQQLVDRFDTYVAQHASGIAWNAVPLTELKEWNWQRLLDTTYQFMIDNAHHYDAALAYTWQGEEPGRNKLARVCWNTAGWQRPSGPAGKSIGAGTHESEAGAGFGAEEWLFDFERLIDGYHYAFLQPLNNEANRGANFNIRLFTRDSTDKASYYVGRLRDAHVLTDEERQAVSRKYRRLGWYDQMQRELDEVGGDSTFDNGDELAPFNVRFRPEDVERPVGGLEEIEELSEWTGSQRYKLFNDHSSYTPKPATNKVQLVFKGKSTPKNTPVGTRRTRQREAELIGLHDQVQDSLLAKLQQQYPKQKLEMEARIEPYGTEVDLVRVRPDGGYVFYEVKVMGSAKACIREALGQLLEYAHWPACDLAAEWVIVSYHAPTKEVAEYLEKLRQTYALPVSYEHIPLAK